MFRPVYRVSSHPMLTLAAIIFITAALLTSSILPSPRSAYAASIGSPACKLTVQNTDPSLQRIAQYYQLVFDYACPPLVKRFGLTPNINLTLEFKSDLSANASESGSNYIGVSSALLRDNPDQATDKFILQLIQIIQNYDSNNTITWFPQTMAYYACSIYCPTNDPSSFLPPSVQSTDSYETPDVGARFLHWLEQHTVPTIVDQLNHAIQTRQSFPTAFQRLAGGPVDQLWSKYKANSELAAFQRFPVPSDPATRSTSCKLTIQNSDPSLDDILRRYQTAFNTVCPQLVARFALKPNVANNVVLIVSPHINAPAFTLNNHITLDDSFARQNLKQVVGALIHELTHVIQASENAPGWFIEGMADYVRSTYGPADDDWSLPPVQPGDSYTQAYRVTARFLHWLDQHTVPNIVDHLSHAAQKKQSFSATFQRLTGSTVDEEWSKYKADPTIKPFKRLSAPDN